MAKSDPSELVAIRGVLRRSKRSDNLGSLLVSTLNVKKTTKVPLKSVNSLDPFGTGCTRAHITHMGQRDENI